MTNLGTMEKEDDYYTRVIKPGDNASERYSEACMKANKESFLYKQGWLRNGRISLNYGSMFNEYTHFGIENQVDGVGTKTQIYMKQFESLYRIYEENKSETSLHDLLEQTTELMFRMLHDFFAMNADDLRDGEVALAMTNIIDINHLDGERGQIFGEAMAQAMSMIIKETGIAIISGETAVLGESQNCHEIIIFVQEKLKALGMRIDNTKVTTESFVSRGGLTGMAIDNLKENILHDARFVSTIIDIILKEIQSITKQIEMNLGGSIVGMKLEDKLVPLRSGQVIIGFQEIPTELGIIGPRSNGISAIREIMEDLLGPDWPNMTFEDFHQAIIEKGIDILNDHHYLNINANTPSETKLGDIATGKTTIFNPFISHKLLGGIDASPKFAISRLIHVTGNPVKKIASAIGNANFDIELDLDEMPVPQIIRMCQVASGMSDEAAMKKWNMGLPYAIICDKKDAHKIIQEADANGITAKIVGHVRRSISPEPELRITGIGRCPQNYAYTIREAIK